MLKRPMLIALLVTLLVLLACPGPGMTEVIDVDTVWSGEVHLDGKTIVAEGATLLVLPGARLTFAPIPEGREKGGGRLIVFGRLIAQGSSDQPILFTSAEPGPRGSQWEGLRFEQSSQAVSYLSHCIVEYAQSGINGRQSLIQIDHSIFRSNDIGIAARSGLRGSVYDCSFADNKIGIHFEHNNSLKPLKCQFEDNHSAGIVCSNSSPIIENNRLVSNNEKGIACLRGSSPLIQDNLIRGHQYGILTEMISSPTILHNEIVDNDTAISMERISFSVIENNMIRKNRVGIFFQLGGYPHIHQNNIVDNREYAIDMGTYQSIVVARAMPFDRRSERNLNVPSEHEREADSQDEILSSFPRDGLVDAYGNWWGAQSIDEFSRARGGNVSLFEDGYDEQTVQYGGQTYPRDKIGYAGWYDQHIDSARRRSIVYPGVEGRVLHDGVPVPGVRVHVYLENDKNQPGEGLTFSAPTGADGFFSLPLKPGHYRLVAREPTLLSNPQPEKQAPSSIRALGKAFVVEAVDVTKMDLLVISDE